MLQSEQVRVLSATCRSPPVFAASCPGPRVLVCRRRPSVERAIQMSMRGVRAVGAYGLIATVAIPNFAGHSGHARGQAPGGTANSRRAPSRYAATSRACRSAPQPRMPPAISATRGATASPAVAEDRRQAQPPGEEIIQGQGRLPVHRPGDLRLEERVARDQRTHEVALPAEGEDVWRKGPVAVDQGGGRVRIQTGLEGEARGQRVQLRPGSRAGEGQLVGGAGTGPGSGAENRIHGVARHDPVRRVLAAAHPHETRRLDRHPVLAGDLDGRCRVRRRDERPQPGVGANDVVAGEVRSSAPFSVPRISSTSSALAATWSSGPRYGLSVVPMIQWRGHGTRNATRPGIRSVMPPRAGIRLALDDEVAAARGQDLEGAGSERAIRERAPDAGGVEHGRCPHLDGGPGQQVQDRRAGHTIAVLQGAECPDTRDGDGRTLCAGDGRAHDREREPRIVLHRVVVEQRAPQVPAQRFGA